MDPGSEIGSLCYSALLSCRFPICQVKIKTATALYLPYGTIRRITGNFCLAKDLLMLLDVVQKESESNVLKANQKRFLANP